MIDCRSDGLALSQRTPAVYGRATRPTPRAFSRKGPPIRTLLIATNNPGKVREFRDILAGLPIRLTSLAEQGIVVEVPEDGETFAENAAIKATQYARLSGLLTLVDDSGLVVDALGGAPGVRSARFAGEKASDADRIALLLDRLRDVPSGHRQARFVCAIAVAEPTGEVWQVGGRVEGCITRAPRGSFGFGYDPVFYLPEIGRTMAEVEPAEKNRISHRARAGQAARSALREILSGGER